MVTSNKKQEAIKVYIFKNGKWFSETVTCEALHVR